MEQVSKKVLIPWIVSAVLVAACVVIVLLFVTGVLTLSENAKNALGVVSALSLVVFGYAGSKYAGVLKGMKKEED